MILLRKIVIRRGYKYMVVVGVLYIILCTVLLLRTVPVSPGNLDSFVVVVPDRPSMSPSPEQLPLTTDSAWSDRLQSLLDSYSFREHGIKVKWISERISRLAGAWEEVRTDLRSEKPFLFGQQRRRILLFPGLLSEYSAYDFANNAFKGGYLGELVQWSDLIAVLHLLGHKVIVMTSKKQLVTRVPLDREVYDLVFTDYLGLFGLRDSQHFYTYKCKIRVLDSFGTEPIYNFRTRHYSVRNRSDMFNVWGFEDTHQFWTLFPHTPDNSFLGFVVEAPPRHMTGGGITRKDQGVLYGKDRMYLSGKEKFVSAIADLVEVHATFKQVKASTLPQYIVNHGVLKAAQLQRLLQESKLFIGMGFPYDGPGPFEALANGCSFIQPLFRPPHSGKNTGFFGGKPTARELSSQVPYLEHFVGEPYVYTVNIGNRSAVRNAVSKILQRRNFSSFIPHEFTQKGMMERVATYISHQDFCDGPDLALRRPATASSVLHGSKHTPGEAVDGLRTKETCFWSDPGQTHWWMLDLGREVSVWKIRITNVFEWALVKSWGDSLFLDPFVVTLSDSSGNVMASKTFQDTRTFYLWEDVNERAQFVRIDSLQYKQRRYFVLCNVEVYGSSSEHAAWPPLPLLSIKVSRPGQSCKSLCRQAGLVCEHAHFRHLNTLGTLKNVFHCSSAKVVSLKYVDFLPALSVAADTRLDLPAGACATNGNSMLLSCSGRHKNYKRLCPCRRFVKGQIAIPPDDP